MDSQQRSKPRLAASPKRPDLAINPLLVASQQRNKAKMRVDSPHNKPNRVGLPTKLKAES
jgi:hypothetical protein